MASWHPASIGGRRVHLNEPSFASRSDSCLAFRTVLGNTLVRYKRGLVLQGGEKKDTLKGTFFLSIGSYQTCYYEQTTRGLERILD